MIKNSNKKQIKISSPPSTISLYGSLKKNLKLKLGKNPQVLNHLFESPLTPS
jgi:hypothetical protein